MKLVEALESFTESGLRPPPARKPTFPEPLRVPPTLAALWEWCAGERDHGLFLLAHPLVAGFPHDDDDDDLSRSLSNMELSDPETVAWNLTNWPSVARGWPEDWLPIGTDGVGNDLVVDAEGSVWIWSSDIDDEPVLIHASFEQWMSELCHALDDGKLVIQREEYGDRIVYANEWSYERHGDGWERVAAAAHG